MPLSKILNSNWLSSKPQVVSPDNTLSLCARYSFRTLTIAFNAYDGPMKSIVLLSTSHFFNGDTEACRG